LGYKLSKGDPDVWIRAVAKPSTEDSYEYVLVYMDAILAIGIDTSNVLTRLNKYFALKPDSIYPSDGLREMKQCYQMVSRRGDKAALIMSVANLEL
jgi:hypothetical protein